MCNECDQKNIDAGYYTAIFDILMSMFEMYSPEIRKQLLLDLKRYVDFKNNQDQKKNL